MDASPIPAPTSPLLGRDEQLSALASMLGVQRVRQVTLTGAAGCGKTRLAIEIGRQIQDSFPDGAAFVRLSAVSDPGLVTQELARQLGIAAPAVGDPLDALRAVLRRRTMLLILDNFEQVIAAANVVADLTEGCPDVSVLVTSRRPLRLRGERVVVVPPLGLAPAVVSGSAAPMIDAPAVALFCARASAVDPDFVRTPQVLLAVAEICRRLDGLPLAIELAAARSRTLPADLLLSRLAAADSDPWRLLNRAPVDAAPHHRSLYEAIAWSVDLLEPAEAVLLRRLAVFDGTWSIEAAEAVCADASTGEASSASAARLPAVDVMDALSTLVDVHLVEPVRSAPATPRFGFLATIRLVARRMLAEAGESKDLARRHAAYFLELMRAAGNGLEGPAEPRWYATIDAELPELQTALAWLQREGRSEDVLRAAGSLGPYWLHRGQFAVGRRWLGQVPSDGSISAVIAAQARGWSVRLEVDAAPSTTTADRVTSQVQELDDVRRIISEHGDVAAWLRASEHLSYALRIYGHVERAWSVTQEALDRCREPEQAWWRAEHLLRGSLLAEQRGDLKSARDYAEQAVAAARSGANDRILARAFQATAFADAGGDPARMRMQLLNALTLSERVGDRRGGATTLTALGAVARSTSETADWFRRGILESRQIGYRHGVALAVAGIAGLAAESGAWKTAATLHGALSGQLWTLRGQLTHRWAEEYEATVERARQAIGHDAFATAARNGAQLEWESAIDEAIAAAQSMASIPSVRATNAPWPGPPVKPRLAAPDASSALSRREREILALVTDGLTNPEIARRLYLSPKTVMHHTGAIYRKLGVRGRAEAIAQVTRERALNSR